MIKSRSRYVTHNLPEALALGHRLAVLNRGAIQQIGPPREVFERPSTALREVSMGFGPSSSLVSGALAGVIGVPLALGFAGSLSLIVLPAILVGLPRARHRD